MFCFSSAQSAGLEGGELILTYNTRFALRAKREWVCRGGTHWSWWWKRPPWSRPWSTDKRLDSAHSTHQTMIHKSKRLSHTVTRPLVAMKLNSYALLAELWKSCFARGSVPLAGWCSATTAKIITIGGGGESSIKSLVERSTFWTRSCQRLRFQRAIKETGWTVYDQTSCQSPRTSFERSIYIVRCDSWSTRECTDWIINTYLVSTIFFFALYPLHFY